MPKLEAYNKRLDYSYALGVRTLVNKDEGQRSPLGEFGWDGAAGSYIMADLDNGVSIAYLQHVRFWRGIAYTLHVPVRDYTYEALGL